MNKAWPRPGEYWVLRREYQNSDDNARSGDYPPLKIICRDNGAGNVSGKGRFICKHPHGWNCSIWDSTLYRYHRLPNSNSFTRARRTHRKRLGGG